MADCDNKGKRINRRSFLGGTLGASTIGALGALSIEDNTLLAQLGARRGSVEYQPPVRGLQQGEFGGRKLSRLFIGGNLISGSAHAGDLIYQSMLMTRYFTSDKIMETWQIAKDNGINTTLMRADKHIINNWRRFNMEHGGGLHWIAQSAPEQGDPIENARMVQDEGCFAIYFHGGVCDKLAADGKVDEIGETVEGFRKIGIFAGIGAHKLETVKACEEAGLDPQFYMYTVNSVGYHSSDPAEIEAYMKNIDKPWIGFKVLGAGRDHPKPGLTQAFERGADFIALGMFDWQVRDDAALVKEILAGDLNRSRAWMG